MGVRIKIFSYGGSGCTALRHGLGVSHHDGSKHRRVPPSTVPKGCRVGYIAGNPMDAVLSFFGRRTDKWNFPVLHGCNLGVNIDPKMDLQMFIARGRDCFKLEEHFDNWCNRSLRNYPVLFIRYESMCNHLDEIGNWFGQPCDIKHKFRKSDWRTESKQTRDGLQDIYSTLWKKIVNLGEVCQI